MPTGTDNASVKSVMSNVLMIDGSMETFSGVYSRANNDGRRFGTPLTTM